LMDEKNQQNLDINIADRNKNRTKLKNQEWSTGFGNYCVIHWWSYHKDVCVCVCVCVCVHGGGMCGCVCLATDVLTYLLLLLSKIIFKNKWGITSLFLIWSDLFPLSLFNEVGLHEVNKTALLDLICLQQMKEDF
jgi:hypothetical protein